MTLMKLKMPVTWTTSVHDTEQNSSLINECSVTEAQRAQVSVNEDGGCMRIGTDNGGGGAYTNIVLCSALENQQNMTRCNVCVGD